MRAAVALSAVGAFAWPTQLTAEVRFHDAAGGARVKVMSWRDIPFRTVVRQQYDYSCGSAALATLLTYHHGRTTSEAETFRAMYAAGDQEKIRRVGFSMLDMKRFVESRGMRADGMRLTLAELEKQGEPVIALIDLGRYRHFVVVKGVRNGQVLVGDPALGLKAYSAAEFTRLWNGVAFVLHPAGGREGSRFNLASEWSPWAAAPIDVATSSQPIGNLITGLSPLYQITSTRMLDSITGGAPQ